MANLFISQVLLSRLIFLYAALFVTLLLAISRLFIQIGRARLRQYGVGVERVVLVGAGDVGRMVMRTVVARPDYGYQLVGFLDDNPAKGTTDVGPFKALGSIDNFEPVLNEVDLDAVIICLPWQSHRTIQRLLRLCDQHNVQAQVVPDLFQLTKNQMQVQDLNGIPLISTRDVSIQGWNRFVKRSSDLILGGVMSLMLLPVGLLIALAIRLDSKGPIFYVQTRIGRNGEPFACYKFRSMVEGADGMRGEMDAENEASGPLFKVRNDPRRTRVGRFLRRYSLDEIPQFYNVLRGDMSLVGPRPNLPEEVEQYLSWHKRRLSVSPGITGSLAGQRAQRPDLRRDGTARYLLCRKLEPGHGPGHSLAFNPRGHSCTRRLLSSVLPSQRVLILMSNTGDGHRASAEALGSGFDQHFPGRFDVEIIDLLVDHLPSPLSQLPKTYAPLTNHLPRLWQLMWNVGASPQGHQPPGRGRIMGCARRSGANVCRS